MTSRSAPTAVRWSSATDAELDPAELTVADERRRMVIDALKSLTPDQRAALVLVDMEGYSVAEAAQMLDVAEGTIKSRCFRGRAKLAPLLGVLAPAARDATEPGNLSTHRGRPNDWSPARTTARADVTCPVLPVCSRTPKEVPDVRSHA